MTSGWTQAPSNVGKAKNSFVNGGLPDRQSKYVYAKDNVAIHTNICVENDLLYVYGQDFHLRCIDLRNSKELWVSQAGSLPSIAFLVLDNFLVTAWNIYNKDNGVILADFGKEIEKASTADREFNQRDLGAMCSIVNTTNGILRTLDDRNANAGVVIFGGDEGATYIDLGITKLTSDIENASIVYGLDGNTLKAYNFSTQKVDWEIDLAMFLKEADKIGYHINGRDGLIISTNLKDKLICINGKNGSVRWECSIPEYESKYNTKIAMDDQFLIIRMGDGNSGFIFGYDIETGSLKWKNSVINTFGSSVCIAGDLIFTIKDKHVPCALDRYSGNIVWEAEDEITATHIIAGGNKVIYTWTYLSCRIYEWDKPYISPHRK